MKTTETHVSRADLLLYPEVQWDRFGKDFAYGWIERADGKFDFAILIYYLKSPNDLLVSIISSSAKYNEEFSKRLKATKHQDCKRVEAYFDIPNKITLKK